MRTGYLTAAFLLLAVLPFRGGIAATSSPGVMAATEASSEIRDIRVLDQTSNLVDLEIEYYYDGTSDPVLSLIVEYTLIDGRQELVFRKNADYIRKGLGTSAYRIERPMLNPWGNETYRVRVLLGRPETGETIAERSLDKPVSWGTTIAANVSETREFMLMQAKSLFNASDFSSLDDLIESWNDPSVRARDGRWKLDALIWFHKDTNYDYPDGTLTKLHEWKRTNPDSEGAAITEAMFWVGYAWHARGGGYSDTVSDTGRKLFRERLLKAEKLLLASRGYASDNPLWYYVYLGAALGLDWEKQRILQLFTEASRKEPQFYWNSFQTIVAVLPKWGGNHELMDDVARLAAELSKETDGDILYTRAYWYISNNLEKDDDLFRDTLVSWPRMRSGFRELTNKYPDSDWNLNNFAAFACRAGDRSTYLEIIQSMGESRITEKAWKDDYTRDACNQKFFSVAAITGKDRYVLAYPSRYNR